MTMDQGSPLGIESALVVENARLSEQLAASRRKVRAADSRYGMILKSIIDYGIIDLTLDGMITAWNDGARQIMGWTEAEMLDQPFSGLFTKDGRQAGIPQKEMRNALEHGCSNDERWHLCKDGSCFLAESAMMPLKDDAGVVQGFIMVLRDRTEQRRAAKKQQADEGFLQSVLSSSVDCFKVLDLDGRLIFMNDGGLQLLEVDDFSTVHNCPWPDFWRGDGNLDAEAALEAARNGALGRFQGQADTMAGNSRWWDVQVTPIVGPGGRPERLLSVSRDITAAKLGEQATAQSEQRYRTLYNAIDVGFCLIEVRCDDRLQPLDFRFLEVNAAFEHHTGIKDATGRWMRDIEPEHEQYWFDRYAAIARTGQSARFEYTAHMLGDRHYEVYAYRIGHPDEHHIAILFTDITERKQEEIRRAALLELNDRLRDLDDAAELSFVVAEVMGRTLDVDRAGYATIHADSETMMIERDWTAPDVSSGAGLHRLDSYGDAISSLRQRETIVINDVAQDARVDAAVLAAFATQALINVPLIEGGQLVSFLFVNCCSPRAWTAGEAAFIRSVAEYTCVALERRRAEHGMRELAVSLERQVEALRASEARLLALMDQSSAGIAQTTLEGRFIFVNDHYCALVGRSREELLSLEMQSLAHPDDLPVSLTQFKNLALGRNSFEVARRYLRPDGSSVWVRDSVTGVREADGAITSVFAVSLDVSDQKQAAMREAFLLGLTDRLRVEDAPGGIMRTAVDLLGRHLDAGRVGYAFVQPDNKTIVLEPGYACGMRSLSGSYAMASYDDDSITGQRKGQTVVSDDTRTLPTPERWSAFETGSFVSVPLIRDGCLRASFYVNHAGPHAWTADEVTLIEEVAARTWDALDRTRAEAALRDAHDTLEQRVLAALAEREKLEDVLRQSQKMEAVGQLTGGLAHDFNNLLMGVIGSLELTQIRIAQGRIKDVDRYINAAQSAAQRAAALTHRLLAFSRRQTLDPKPTDVNRLVRGMEDLVRRTVGPEVTVEPMVGAAGLWSTLIDPGQLENALLNLCINARDAMPDGGKITIETGNRWLDERTARARDLQPGQYVSLCVSDTGTGMTRDVIAKAFEPFFTTKPIGQGTGLGLSMIYGFAKQSNGQVQIYSELGQGTMVCLYLPRHVGVEESVELAPELSDAPRAEQGETVLVVDDEPTVRMLVTEVLEDLGYTPIEAADGAAALKVLRSDVRIDLLVSDVGLPGGMNGRQVADAARVARPDLKVLFITGYAENAVLSHGHLDPGMHVLTKPFALEALASRIKDLITSC